MYEDDYGEDVEELTETERQDRRASKVLPGDPEWKEWLRICEYTRWEPFGLLKPMKFHGRIIPYSGEIGVTPMFFNELMMKIHKVKPIRMAIVGEAGASKTYTAIQIAKTLYEKLNVDNIVITGLGYMKLVRTINWGAPIVLEEPTFHLAARTWFKEWQQIIVQTVESTRFQNNPLIIPVVNRNLLDKTVREYYLNYVVHMFDRGIGRVYRCKHSQWTDRNIRNTAYNIYVFSPAMDLIECGRETCLNCPNLMNCNKSIWPQYERKRAEAIEFYQQKGQERLEAVDLKKKTFAQLVDMILEDWMKYTDKDGIIRPEKIMYHLGFGMDKAKRLVKEVEDRLTQVS